MEAAPSTKQIRHLPPAKPHGNSVRKAILAEQKAKSDACEHIEAQAQAQAQVRAMDDPVGASSIIFDKLESMQLIKSANEAIRAAAFAVSKMKAVEVTLATQMPELLAATIEDAIAKTVISKLHLSHFSLEQREDIDRQIREDDMLASFRSELY